jgi:hypothetical protein
MIRGSPPLSESPNVQNTETNSPCSQHSFLPTTFAHADLTYSLLGVASWRPIWKSANEFVICLSVHSLLDIFQLHPLIRSVLVYHLHHIGQ